MSAPRATIEITAEASGDVPEWWTADLMRRDLLLAVDLCLDEIQDGLSGRLGDPKEGSETTLAVRAQALPPHGSDLAMEVCFFAATALLTNQRGWMAGLANRINRYLESVGDKSRVHFDGEMIRTRVAP